MSRIDDTLDITVSPETLRILRISANKFTSQKHNMPKRTYSQSNKSNKSKKSNKSTTSSKSSQSKRKSIINNYISKLINMYYNNDIVSNNYLQQAHTIQHIYPQQRRIIVIGDIHGDFEVAIKCLILAGCIENIIPPTNKTVNAMDKFFNSLKWIGEDTYIVQLGDQIDRVRPQKWDTNNISQDIPIEDEGSTLEIFYLFYYLDQLARKHLGRVLCIIGNHEIMNIEGDFSYVSKKEFNCFNEHLQHIYHKQSKFPYHSRTLTQRRDTTHIHKSHNKSHNKSLTRVLPDGYRERLLAFAPTGLCANFIGSNYYTMLQIGNWLFCHGSPTLDIVNNYSIDMINSIVSSYLLGIDTHNNHIVKHFTSITANNGILWDRTFGEDKLPENTLSHKLNNILNTYNTKQHNINTIQHKTNTHNNTTHIAIGHTPQYTQGINSICNQHVWRCDVAMSKAFQTTDNNNNSYNNTTNTHDTTHDTTHNTLNMPDTFKQGDIQVLEILNGVPKILSVL